MSEHLAMTNHSDDDSDLIHDYGVIGHRATSTVERTHHSDVAERQEARALNLPAANGRAMHPVQVSVNNNIVELAQADLEIERQLNQKLRDEIARLQQELVEIKQTTEIEYEKVDRVNKRIVKTNKHITDELTKCRAEHDKLLEAERGWEMNAQETAKNMELMEARIQKEIDEKETARREERQRAKELKKAINEKESVMREERQRTEELKEVKQKLCVLEIRELTNINRLNAEKINPSATEEIVIKQLGTYAVGRGAPTCRQYRDNYVIKSTKVGAQKVLLENGDLGIWFQSKYILSPRVSAQGDVHDENGTFVCNLFKIRKDDGRYIVYTDDSHRVVRNRYAIPDNQEHSVYFREEILP